MIKASWCAAFILVAGLVSGLESPSQAAPADSTAETPKSDAAAEPAEPTRQSRPKRHSERHSSKAAKSDKTSSGTSPSATAASRSAAASPGAMPPSVANANAQFTEAGAAGTGANTATDRAKLGVQAAADAPASPSADSRTVAADQLNEVDRALTQDPPSAPKNTPAADASPPATTALAARRDNLSTWDQTSLIGKIFVGFGALLTVASAARLFIA